MAPLWDSEGKERGIPGSPLVTSEFSTTAGTTGAEVPAPADESSVLLIAAGERTGLAIHNSSAERTLICSVGAAGGKSFAVPPLDTVVLNPAPIGAIYGYWTFGTAGGGATATEW